MWSILKVFIEIVAELFLFWLFGHEVCGIERAPLALEGEILTSRPVEKSLQLMF